MPVYEYVPDDRECFMCPNRFEVIQDIDEEPLKWCPSCGLEVCRAVSRASFKVDSGNTDVNKAAEKGFTTFKRTGDGNWEKLAGPGAEGIARPGTEPEQTLHNGKPVKTIEL